MIHTAVDGFLMVRGDTFAPEAPPGSGKILLLVRYFTWLAIISGPAGIAYAGGRFAWEKWNGGPFASAKTIAGGLLGGIVTTGAGAIMNSLIS
ncbi:hypothetical protein ACL02S_01145 [Nocardia sp. 004]|uniref:hypothetical protein n=1 Tax=Nocardia sp. 004 TaxID=3385978 RepID=UPI0039A1411A